MTPREQDPPRFKALTLWPGWAIMDAVGGRALEAENGLTLILHSAKAARMLAEVCNAEGRPPWWQVGHRT